MAQRLVRRVCPNCQQNYSPQPEAWQRVLSSLAPIQAKLNPEIQAKLAQNPPSLIQGRGCDKCNQTGYTGRQVIVEILIPNDIIETLISKKASISEFEKAAQAMGMITMEQDGLIKALLGQTTIDEVWRVTMG